MREEWRPVIGYEGLYEVSNLGNVKSLNYGGVTGRKKLLKLRKDKDGYLRVCLSKKGVVKDKKVHRLVAEAFIPNPENKTDVDHKDKIPYNNNISNLQWLTRSENIKKGYDQGRVTIISDKCKLAVKETSQIISIWINDNLNFKGSANDLIRQFPEMRLNKSNLSLVRKGKQLHHKGWTVIPE